MEYSRIIFKNGVNLCEIVNNFKVLWIYRDKFLIEMENISDNL